MNTYDETTAERLVGIAARRVPPTFLILDAQGNVVSHSHDLDEERVLRRVLEAFRATVGEQPNVQQPSVFPLNDESVMRVIPLLGAMSGSLAVFVERVKPRGSLQLFASRYSLTKREVEVLALVVRSYTSAQIAQQLFISEGTVGDHVKSLLRKTKSSKRSELLARVLNVDPEADALAP